MHWYVQVQGQNYGPYSEEQMRTFATEGRINEHSLLSNDVQAGFFPAVGFENYAYWSGTQAVAAAVNSPSTYQTANPVDKPQAQDRVPVSQPGIFSPTLVDISNSSQAMAEPSSVFLIMAEINSEGSMGFLQALQGFGIAQRISNTVWLLKSTTSVEQLRNALSQTLDRQDRLFILDSKSNKPAWFNIGTDLDHRIRELWQDENG